MSIRIGIIGPKDSIERILYVAPAFPEAEFLTFPYERTEEVDGIIKANSGRIDQWLFSGQAPYYYALRKRLITEHIASFPPLHGASFFGALLKAQWKDQRVASRISIDTIPEAELKAACKMNGIEGMELHSCEYKEYKPAQELISFHEALYKAGRIDLALTCLKEVATRLEEMGIPCQRIVPSHSAIMMVLRFVVERAHSAKFRKAQVAIVGVKVKNIFEDAHYSFEKKLEELELHRLLLEFARAIDGSFVQLGDGLFFIYTTRGELDLFFRSKSLFTLMEQARQQANTEMFVGIGYGGTVYEAELHVRFAFQHAQDQTAPVIITVNEDREVTELFETEDEISFASRGLGKEWEKLFKEATISSATAEKILSFARHYEKRWITSQEVAHWLNSSERNGRRILSEMERLDLVKVSGEEQSGSRGRPRKMYEILV